MGMVRHLIVVLPATEDIREQILESHGARWIVVYLFLLLRTVLFCGCLMENMIAVQIKIILTAKLLLLTGLWLANQMAIVSALS